MSCFVVSVLVKRGRRAGEGARARRDVGGGVGTERWNGTGGDSKRVRPVGQGGRAAGQAGQAGK